MRKQLFIVSVFIMSGVLVLFSAPVALAMDTKFFIGNNIANYDPDFEKCEGGGTPVKAKSDSKSGSSNKDYAGQDILTKAQLDAITANQPVYEEAATAAKIPWQMIAVIHLRETGLAKVNPENGQGIYQNYGATPNQYPAGPVNDEGFLSQSKWAAEFLKGKSDDPALLESGDEATVKDTFFGYNGRAGAYVKQAQSLGYSEDQGYEGSPYVMNKADEKRDPNKNSKWGQIKKDGGDIEYPANEDYGAFVVYGSLAGLSGACSTNGPLQEKIIQVAEAELAKYQSGEMKTGTDYYKYSYGSAGDWCAWFVSWVLKEAGSPVNSSDPPTWSTVSRFFVLGVPEKGYVTHMNDGSYTPVAGDLAIYGSVTPDGAGGYDVYHINIVVGMNGNQVITIGGNEGAGENGNFTQSKIVKTEGFGNQAAMYITVK